jgi:nucleotide-binding universal stress UspA family protein
MKIVVGYDGSEGARRALERAARLDGDGEPVTVVSVHEVHVSAGRGPARVDETERAERDEELAEATGILREHGVQARPVHGHGDPARAISEEAEATGADLIVVGTHGRGAFGRAMLGSVSSRLVHRAPCDVLVVR